MKELELDPKSMLIIIRRYIKDANYATAIFLLDRLIEEAEKIKEVTNAK